MTAESAREEHADLEAQLRARYNEQGFAGLTENQITFLCVIDLYWSEFTDYFIRSAAFLDAELGEDEDREPTDEEFVRQAEFEAAQEVWRDHAEAGLKTIGAPRAADCFREAREKQDWSEAEERFRKAENVDELLARFVEEHPADFQFEAP